MPRAASQAQRIKSNLEARRPRNCVALVLVDGLTYPAAYLSGEPDHPSDHHDDEPEDKEELPQVAKQSVMAGEAAGERRVLCRGTKGPLEPEPACRYGEAAEEDQDADGALTHGEPSALVTSDNVRCNNLRSPSTGVNASAARNPAAKGAIRDRARYPGPEGASRHGSLKGLSPRSKMG